MSALTESTPFQTAEQHVYLHLRQRILSGELPGGTPINPIEVASTLSLSRMPVREALRQLDAEGLVTIMPNRRAVVTRLTAAEVEEIFEIRAVLEGLAIRFAVPNFDEVRLAELELLNQSLNNTQLAPRAWLQRHADLHDYIVEVAGRPHLGKQIKRMHNAVQPYLLMYISVYQHSEMIGYEHEKLISCIRRCDPVAAEAFMIDHVRSASRGVIEFVTRREKGEALLRPATK